MKNLENAKRILLATVMTGLCWVLPGCQSISSTTNYAQVRFIDASPDAPGIDIYEGNSPIVYNMGFTTVTSYVPISPGSYRFTVKTAGSTQTLVTTTAGFSTGHQYTVLVSDSVVTASLQETILTDQSTPAPSGQIAVRIVNEAILSGPYDVYMVPSGTALIAVHPIVTGSSTNTVGAYINVPTGSYSVVIVPAGTVLTSTTVATYTSPVTAFTAGSAHSFIILDQQVITTPGAQVLTTDDYESPGAIAPN